MAIFYLDKHRNNCYCDPIKRCINNDVFYNGNEFILIKYHECMNYNEYDSFVNIINMLSIDDNDRFKFDNYIVDRVLYADKILKEYRKGVKNFNTKIAVIHYICYSSNNFKKLLYSTIDFKTFLLTSANVKEHYKSFIQEVDEDDFINDYDKEFIKEQASNIACENFTGVSDRQVEITTEFLIKQISKKL